MDMEVLSFIFLVWSKKTFKIGSVRHSEMDYLKSDSPRLASFTLIKKVVDLTGY